MVKDRQDRGRPAPDEGKGPGVGNFDGHNRGISISASVSDYAERRTAGGISGDEAIARSMKARRVWFDNCDSAACEAE